MSMGGKGPEVLVTLTTDFGKILEGIHRTKIRGSTHLATGIQIAGVGLCNSQDSYGDPILTVLLLSSPSNIVKTRPRSSE